MARSGSADDPQFCNFCGAELDRRVFSHPFLLGYVVTAVKCPNIRWWKRDNWKHTDKWLRYEEDETILNFDPITGERIKK